MTDARALSMAARLAEAAAPKQIAGLGNSTIMVRSLDRGLAITRWMSLSASRLNSTSCALRRYVVRSMPNRRGVLDRVCGSRRERRESTVVERGAKLTWLAAGSESVFT